MSQHNYLLIGLGGTGCAVVRELKKKLYTEWRSRAKVGDKENADSPQAANGYPEVYEFQDDFGGETVKSRIATLSVDSNADDLDGQGERLRKWRVFGETLRLYDEEKVLLSTSGLTDVLANLSRFPNIEPWISQEMDFVQDIARGTTGSLGCNQTRRLGRLALANGQAISKVVNAIGKRLDLLTKNGEVGAEIHVACTLGCGTGSGAVLDTVAQLQRHLKNQPGKYDVYIHGFVTAKDVGKVNTGNFYANQYAALTELNAFRLGLYQPWDIKAEQKPARLSVPRSDDKGSNIKDLNDSFKSLALISETTEGGINIPLAQQIDSAAELIFQGAVRQMGDLPKEIRDAFTAEDRAQYPADSQGGTRSTAFTSYGVQRVAIPEREIREKLSYSFGQQFVLKVLYNTWDDRYRNISKAFGKDSFVAKRRAIWKVNREHLCLDLVEGATGEPEFKLYEVEWRERLEIEKQKVKEILGEGKERRGWLKDFDQRATRFWEEGFRSRGRDGGVIDYFKIRNDPSEIRTRARTLRSYIEKDLLLGIERMDQEYVVHHLPDAVDFLKQRIEEDRKNFDELEQTAVDSAREADRKREEIRPEFEKCGVFAKGKQEKLFSAYQRATTQYYYWQTMQYAARYGHEFCRVFLDELQDMQKQVLLFDTRLKMVSDFFEQEQNDLIPEKTPGAPRKDVVHLVDAGYVNSSIRDRFESRKEMQDLNAHTTMEALRTIRGDRFEFAAYLDEMPVDEGTNRVNGAFVNKLRKISEVNAVEAHRQVLKKDEQFEGILGQNIIHKLYNDYGGVVNERLEQWLRDIIGKSMPMVAFNENSQPMDLPSQGPVLRRCIFLPSCSKHVEFEHALREKMQSITGNKGCWHDIETYIKEVPEDRNSTEITILSVASFFPARHTRVVHGLQTLFNERVQQRVEKECTRARFEVFTETHYPPLPDLMKPDTKTVLEQHLASVLLASALGLMQIPEKDQDPILLGHVDSYGRIQGKINSGLRVQRELREMAEESESRFGHMIPASTLYLFVKYLDEFKEDSIHPLEDLLRTWMKENGKKVDMESLKEDLNNLGGHCFVLGGKDQNDPKVELFENKSKDAYTLACQLNDRSRL